MCCVKENNCRIDHSTKSTHIIASQPASTHHISIRSNWAHEMYMRVLCSLFFRCHHKQHSYWFIKAKYTLHVGHVPIHNCFSPYTRTFDYSTASNGAIHSVLFEVGMSTNWSNVSERRGEKMRAKNADKEIPMVSRSKHIEHIFRALLMKLVVYIGLCMRFVCGLYCAFPREMS